MIGKLQFFKNLIDEKIIPIKMKREVDKECGLYKINIERILNKT